MTRNRSANHLRRAFNVKHAVSRELHAVDRNRALTAAALGYAVEGGPDYGIDRKRIAPVSDAPYALLFHATAQERKEWPEDRWIEVGKALEAKGITPLLPWGNERERARSEHIKSALKNARVPEKQPLGQVAGLIAGATLVAGVNTASCILPQHWKCRWSRSSLLPSRGFPARSAAAR